MFFKEIIWRKVSQQVIKELNLLPDLKESKVVVAFSGGIDSLFLLAALSELRKKYKFLLLPLYIQHGMIPENKTYAQIAKLSARRLGWEYRSAKIKPKPPKTNTEDWMRQERYRILEKYRKDSGAKYIAVAHHEDDQAETVLAHMIRGCGIKGLGAMPFQRDKIIRPLIKVAKLDMENLIKQTDLPYYNDKLNFSQDYQRNKIRHELLPYLRKNFNPQISTCLAKLADAAREIENN